LNEIDEFDQVLSFAAISSHLQTFIAEKLQPEQMIEIADNCGSNLRSLLTFFNNQYSAGQVKEIFDNLTKLDLAS
jgi:hypothetical protein